MSSVAGTIPLRAQCNNISLHRQRKHTFPVDYYLEMPIDRPVTDVQAAYLIDAGNPESVVCLDHGRHRVDGGQEIVVLESGDRISLAPEVNCMLEYNAGYARLVNPGPCARAVTVGVKNMRLPAIETGADIESLFQAVSLACSAPGETSPYRSHPLFRNIPPDINLSSGVSCLPQIAHDSPIRLRLPPDLRYLFAAAPLACYLGASIETGEQPGIDVCGKSIGLPRGYPQFERWAGKMLSHTFQTDCAVRCEAVTGRRLPGIDVRAITGYAPEELMLITLADRFQLYSETIPSSRRPFNTWHMASYVEPVPSSVEILPFLMRSLSAVYAPRSTRLSERDVVSLSARNFREQHACPTRGDDEFASAIVLPSLYNAQSQHWYSDGCPIDAALSRSSALKNGRKYARSRLLPEICVICNEAPMAREAQILKDLLDCAARVEVRTDLGCDDLLHTFSEGFDIVHYAGHCDRDGLKCRDGAADLSSVGTCNVPVFFLNSCSSYLQGARLIDKGAVCGIATMFRLLDEAALDVSVGFYRMLARGYPIMTSYLAARECSVTGKEYLLIGDGFYRVFNSGSSFMPFYRLNRNSRGFSVQCKIHGGDKGLIVRAANGQAFTDTGFEMAGVCAEDLTGSETGLDGMCLYGTGIYDCVADAVSVALIDLKRTKTIPHGRSSGIRALKE